MVYDPKYKYHGPKWVPSNKDERDEDRYIGRALRRTIKRQVKGLPVGPD